MSALDHYKDAIASALSKHGYRLTVDQIEIPKQKEHGDFAVPCFLFVKEKKKSPFAIALDIQNILEKHPLDGFEKVEQAGPYLNLFLDKRMLARDMLNQIAKEKRCIGSSRMSKDAQKVMVEFCSPNTNKPLHLGHIRNMLLGESVSSLLSYTGRKVVKSCLVNDRGIHICKSMLAYKLWGKKTTPKKEGKKGDHLVGDFYVMYSKNEDDEMKRMVSEMLQRWEDGEKETMKLWKTMNTWVLEGFNETYEKLGVSFDKFYYESKIYDKGKDIVMKGLEDGIFKKEDGAVVAPLEEKDKKLPDKVLVRSDGTTIYMTQDIYLAIKKIEDYGLDSSVYVVGSEQNLHFQQLFTILDMLGYEQAKKCFHLSYGMVNLPEGKMKSREGTVVDADDLIVELEKLAAEEIMKRDSKITKKELARRAHQIAMGGLKFFLLKQDPVKDMTYNPKESLSFEGETGPYVQYTAVRIASIIEKAGGSIPKKVDFDRMEEPELDLVVEMARYEDIVYEAAEKMRPNLVANYLMELSQAFNSYYHSVKIVNTGMERERIFLISNLRHILVSGLGLLGIDVPERM